MKNNNTKETFINTASVLFAVKGYHATGISEILKRSEAPKGSLYYYFPQGKEQLALEALQRTAHNIYTEIESSLADTSNPVEGLQRHLRLIARKIQQDITGLNTDKLDLSISLIALETYFSNEKIRLKCQEIFTEMQKIYRQKFIEYGIDDQIADFFAMNAVILTEGCLILSVTQKDVSPLLTVAKHLPLLFKNDDISG